MTNRADAAGTRGLLLAAVALLVTVSAIAQPRVTDIDRFYRVDDAVATGAQPTLDQLAALKHEGFRTLVNLREPSEHDAERESSVARELGLSYVAIPVKTADPKDEQVDAFLEALADPNVFPAFLHCGSGNRVGAFWMVRRVLVDGWGLQEAENEARRIGLKSPNLVEFACGYIRRHSGKNLCRPPQLTHNEIVH